MPKDTTSSINSAPIPAEIVSDVCGAFLLNSDFAEFAEKSILDKLVEAGKSLPPIQQFSKRHKGLSKQYGAALLAMSGCVEAGDYIVDVITAVSEDHYKLQTKKVTLDRPGRITIDGLDPTRCYDIAINYKPALLRVTGSTTAHITHNGFVDAAECIKIPKAEEVTSLTIYARPSKYSDSSCASIASKFALITIFASNDYKFTATNYCHAYNEARSSEGLAFWSKKRNNGTSTGKSHKPLSEAVTESRKFISEHTAEYIKELPHAIQIKLAIEALKLLKVSVPKALEKMV